MQRAAVVELKGLLQVYYDRIIMQVYYDRIVMPMHDQLDVPNTLLV